MELGESWNSKVGKWIERRTPDCEKAACALACSDSLQMCRVCCLLFIDSHAHVWYLSLRATAYCSDRAQLGSCVFFIIINIIISLTRHTKMDQFLVAPASSYKVCGYSKERKQISLVLCVLRAVWLSQRAATHICWRAVYCSIFYSCYFHYKVTELMHIRALRLLSL